MEFHKELVIRASQEDPEAFALLYKEIYKDLYRFAYYTLQNEQDAEDVVGEAVLDAYKGIRNLRNPDAFQSWMFQIVSNKCKRKIGEYKNRTYPMEESGAEVSVELGDNTAVFDTMKYLSGEERMIVSMSVFGGYKGKEIGDFLHMKHSTIRSKYRRALEKMKDMLEHE